VYLEIRINVGIGTMIGMTLFRQRLCRFASCRLKLLLKRERYNFVFVHTKHFFTTVIEIEA
jgi:hypothetical protein